MAAIHELPDHYLCLPRRIHTVPGQRASHILMNEFFRHLLAALMTRTRKFQSQKGGTHGGARPEKASLDLLVSCSSRFTQSLFPSEGTNPSRGDFSAR